MPRDTAAANGLAVTNINGAYHRAALRKIALCGGPAAIGHAVAAS
jgi:hypothetical protein